MRAVRELEHIMDGLALDIEFAINKDHQVILFQMRPLVASYKQGNVYDDNAFFKLLEKPADMYEHHQKCDYGRAYDDDRIWHSGILRRSLEITPDRWIIPCIGPSLRIGRGIRGLQGLDSENFQKI